MARKKICLLDGTVITIAPDNRMVAVPVGRHGTVLSTNASDSDIEIGDVIFVPWTAVKYEIEEDR